ncbi:MAG: hypothetical protein WKF58_10445 [Ilumatobacteraceae bacterium]
MTHGLVMLVITEAIGEDDLNRHLPEMSVAAYAGFGDDPAAARRSVELGTCGLSAGNYGGRGGRISTVSG